jgi:hypothetical protein
MVESYLKERFLDGRPSLKDDPQLLNDGNVCADAGYGKDEKPPPVPRVAGLWKEVSPGGVHQDNIRSRNRRVRRPRGLRS